MDWKLCVENLVSNHMPFPSSNFTDELLVEVLELIKEYRSIVL